MEQMQELKTGIKETRELLVAIKDFAVLAGKVMEDGKVGLDDLSHVLAELPKIGKTIEAFKGLDQLPAEFKDLDGQEIQVLIDEVLAIVNEVKKVI